MGMTTIENTSERAYDLTAPPERNQDGTIKLGVDGMPKAGVTVHIPRGHGGDAGDQNGSAEIDEEVLARAMKDVVVAAWFKSGDLVKGKAKGTANEGEPEAHAADHRKDKPGR